MLQKQGLWQVLKPKFVYAQNAMQAAMMVDKGLVDAGFVPVSSKKLSIALIIYHGVVLKNKQFARFFLNELRSHAALSYNMRTALRGTQ